MMSSSNRTAPSESVLELETAAAGVLHDVRGFMCIAKGLAHRATHLIETGRGEEAIAMLQRIDRTASKGAELCGDVLECTRRNGDSGLELVSEEVDLVTLAREQISLHAVAIRQYGSCVDLLACADECVLVRTHRSSVERVLSNLLQNAARYGAGRPIDVLVSGDAWGARLVVRDRGRGIPPEQLERLFAPYRSKGDLDVCFQRFGLGLWIVRHLARSLGGTLHVASEGALGTAVSVSLPPTAR